MQGRNELAMLHLQKHFGYADDSCCCLQMADIGFDRADPAGLLLYMVCAESTGHTGSFNWVPEFGACTVRFDIPNASRVEIGFFQGLQNQVGLRFRIGSRVSRSPPTVVDHSTLNHTINVVAVPHSLVQGLEKKRTNALSGYITIGAFSKGAGNAVYRQGAASSIDIELGLMQVQVCTADDGGRAFARLDGFTSKIDGGQAGGTCRIHRQARTRKIHPIRDTIGDAPEERMGRYLCPGVLPFNA